jgi:MOSC domain-containing protein YiiM
MSAYITHKIFPFVLSVNISPGGIPKLPIDSVSALKSGLQGDGRNHAKHILPDRAVSLWDYELLQHLVAEGFSSLKPGAAGENLTVTRLNVQSMTAGTLLRIGDTVLKLEQPRKPCYVLDAIDPCLKDAIVGRCGYLASVVREGTIRPGMQIEVISPHDVTCSPTETEVIPTLEPVATPPGSLAFHLLAGPTIG